MLRALRSHVGQTAAEYTGVLLLVAAIVAGIISTDIGAQIGRELKEIVCRITGGECGGEAQQAPSQCVISEATDKFTVNGEVNLRVVKVQAERGLEYLRQKRADGNVAMTFKLNGAAGIGGKIPKVMKGKLAASVKGGNSAQVTFVLPNDAAANKFAEQLKDTAKAAVTPPLIGWAMGRKKPHIDWPEVESVAYEGTVQGNVGVGLDDIVGNANVAIEGGVALGVRKNLTEGKKDSGDITTYYRLNGKGSGNVASHFVGPEYAGALAGDLTLSVVWDEKMNPKTLTVLGQGGYEGGEVPRVKLGSLKQALKRVDALDIRSGSQGGKKAQFQIDLDLKDPQVQASALAFLRGVNPAGGVADKLAAGRELWNTIEQKGKLQVRHYDTNSHNTSASVDAVVAGGGFAYDTTAAELTSANDYQPGEGFVPSAVCKR